MSSPSSAEAVVPIESIASAILVLRGQKVILDADLARLYGTTTKRLNQQVKRNIERFPCDFMFQLTEEETEFLRSQIVTASRRCIFEVANCDLKLRRDSYLKSRNATSSSDHQQRKRLCHPQLEPKNFR